MARPDITTLLRRGPMTRRRLLAGSAAVAAGAIAERARAALSGELVSQLSVTNGGKPYAGDRAGSCSRAAPVHISVHFLNQLK